MEEGTTKKMDKGLVKETFQKIMSSNGLEHLPGVRELELAGLKISVLQRDIEPDDYGRKRHDIQIIVDVLPGCDLARAKKNIQEVLFEMFTTADMIETIFQDQARIRRELGFPLQDFNNFFIGIQWPRSSFYTLDQVRYNFIRKMGERYA